MNIKTKLTFGIGVLVAMIVLLVVLSAVNLQILTATEPDSPAAGPGLQRALMWIYIVGIACILIGIGMLFRLPSSINKPIKELTNGIMEIANHNYQKRLNLGPNEEFIEVAESFNRMAERLAEYRASTLSDLLAGKKYIEAIVNSITEPIIGLNKDKQIVFVNEAALNVLNLKREAIINQSAPELSLKNDLLRRLIRELLNPGDTKEPLKIYADNKESYFQAKYIPIKMVETGEKEQTYIGDVILLKNITEFKELDAAKTTFISTISHELKTPISAILMSLQLLEDKRVGALNEEQEELSKSIKENSERLLGITGELLNLTQVEAGKLQLMPKITKPIELIDYAIKANRVQAERFGIQIEVEYPEEKVSKLFVDSEKISDGFAHQEIKGQAERKQRSRRQNHRPHRWAEASRSDPGAPVTDVHQSIAEKGQNPVGKRHYKHRDKCTYNQIKDHPLAEVFYKIRLQFCIPLPRLL